MQGLDESACEARLNACEDVEVRHMARELRQAADRFQAAYEALQRLSHPHIAQFVEAGVTACAEPFARLESVEGLRLDQYCAKHSLEVEQRLRLFIQVCEALTHARLRGVVHGQIEPANVLVTRSREVCLLNTGLGNLMATWPGASRPQDPVCATKSFVSPEQLRGAPPSAASDAYSLGCLLHLLLTGAPPPTPPVPPSELIDPTEKPALHQRIRGDIDLVTMKATRKEPRLRYPDSAELGDDIRRHLNHFPVHARRKSRLDGVLGFARRRPARVQIAAAVLIACVAGTYFTLAHEGRNVVQGKEPRGLDTEADDAILEAKGLALHARAETLLGAGQAIDGMACLEEALEVFRTTHGESHPTYARTAEALGRAYCSYHREPEGIALLRQALAVHRSVHGATGHADLAWCLLDLGGRLAATDHEEGAALVEEAVTMYRRLPDVPASVLTFALDVQAKMTPQVDPQHSPSSESSR